MNNREKMEEFDGDGGYPDPQPSDSQMSCSHCGTRFDGDSEGNYDDNTGLVFCWADCEMNYDRTIGLPVEYERASC